MEMFLQPETYVALATLTFLEIVLGVDNIIFISILANKLPEEKQTRTRNTGLFLALFLRIALLLGITWIISASDPLFSVLGHDVSIRDLILLVGGLFLIAKSTGEIHHKMEGDEEHHESKQTVRSVGAILGQIVVMDVIFSFDSILTAVGLTQEKVIMIVAVIIAMFVMMAFSGKIAKFIGNHPTLEILALSFLILIGFMLVLDAAGQHVPKGYIYFAVFFSMAVELINMNIRSKRIKPVKSRE
ncbi:MAG: hypothetical protein CL840_21925 [Crocinitomicaceae bacterium]|nr:hypothetical protein [Crocinitomicaceae bacterium]|tara:strand:- start:4757 stop:5488 length:732 start_codon:yes stop_codon:yes gene_type:complete